MSNDLKSEEILEVSLKTLRLRPGIFLKIQRMREGSRVNEAQFIAAIEDKGVMLTPSGTDSLKTEIIIGEEYRIQGFTGQTDFSFVAPVLNVFKAPFAHALVAYPALVKAKNVRKSMRMKTAFPASISPFGQKKPIKVSIIDLSVSGAMISSPLPLGAVGSRLDFSFSILFDGVISEVDIATKLCHSTLADNEGCMIGLSFEDLSRDHKLILNYFVGKITQENELIHY